MRRVIGVAVSGQREDFYLLALQCQTAPRTAPSCSVPLLKQPRLDLFNAIGKALNTAYGARKPQNLLTAAQTC